MREENRCSSAIWAAGAIGSLAALYAWSYADFAASFFVFDDFWQIAAADRIHSSKAGLSTLFEPAGSAVFFRPLTQVGYFYTLRALWGIDPTGYYWTHIAFHIANALLVYAIATRMFDSRSAGLATAFVYATAPGHAYAVRWLSLFTITGTAFCYFLALLAWLEFAGRTRTLVTTGCVIAALCASEHAATLPIALFGLAVIGVGGHARDAARELAAPLGIGAIYLVAKFLQHQFATPRPLLENPPAEMATAYQLSVDPGAMLTALGAYAGYSVNLGYRVWTLPGLPLWIGIAIVCAAVVATLGVASGRWRSESARPAAFGLCLFVLGLGPVLVIPGHFYSAYVGIAALGAALGVVGLLLALPAGRFLVPAAAAGMVLIHLFWVVGSVRQSPEIQFLDSSSQRAERWLLTIDEATRGRDVVEVFIPRDQLTQRMFGSAHQIFLCRRYSVATVSRIREVRAAPQRVVLARTSRLLTAGPDEVGGARDWSALIRPCEPTHAAAS